MKLIKNTKVITPFIEILDAYIVAIDEESFAPYKQSGRLHQSYQ